MSFTLPKIKDIFNGSTGNSAAIGAGAGLLLPGMGTAIGVASQNYSNQNGGSNWLKDTFNSISSGLSAPKAQPFDPNASRNGLIPPKNDNTMLFVLVGVVVIIVVVFMIKRK